MTTTRDTTTTATTTTTTDPGRDGDPRAGLAELLRRRTALVTGKGGTGRTTLAASIALAAARTGKRTLLAEIEEPSLEARSPLARVFGRERFDDTPRPLEPGLKGVLLRTEHGTRDFLASVLKIRALADLALKMRPLVRLLHAAPSFHEMGVYYHLLSLLQAQDAAGAPEYESVVIDMPSSGHTLSWTSLPDILLSIIPGGPIARAMRQGQAMMYDPAQTAAYVVTLPEKLPVTESLELVEGLRATRVSVGGVFANRMPVSVFGEGEVAALGELTAGRAPVQGLVELERIRAAGAAVERLRREGGLPVWLVGEVDGGRDRRAMVEVLAEVLLGRG